MKTMRLTVRPVLAAAALAILGAALAPACAINPVTGKRQAMFISRDAEFAIGKQADAQIKEEYGVYLDKPELRAYVESVGEKIAAESGQTDIQYHFEVLDSPVVNAMALPGGFVYITRGMLERMNSEDELAAVLGHEVAHVAARHGAAQISKASIAQTGMLALAVLSDPKNAALLGDMANLSVGLALQGYSREYERQADEFGFTYAKRAGYNPKGGVDLLQTLARMKDGEPGTVEAFFMSHPRTSARITNAKDEISEIREKNPKTVNRPRKHDEYLRQIDGIIVGEWNDRVLLKGGKLYDKEHGLALEVPTGTRARLARAPLLAVFDRESDGLQAAVGVEPLDRKKSSQDLLADYEKKYRQQLTRVSTDRSSRKGFEIAEAFFRGKDDQGRAVGVRKAFTVHKGDSVALTVIHPEDKDDPGKKVFDQMVGSLERLDPAEIAGIKPPRLEVRRVRSGESWRTMAGGDADRAKRLAAYNGFEYEDSPPVGRLIKIPPSLDVE